METKTQTPSSLSNDIPAGLVEALTAAYADLIKRQRTASAAFVRWTSPHARAHEFCWIEEQAEVLMTGGSKIRITPDSPVFSSIRKMMATIELNPYERELLYGYPYVVGNVEGLMIRGPILTIPISIQADGDSLIVQSSEENVRFNSLPYRSDLDSGAHEQALDRLVDATPTFPLTFSELQRFCSSVAREMELQVQGNLNGILGRSPSQPRSAAPLKIIDSAACFVAPKTSYFLASDLAHIGSGGTGPVEATALGALLSRCNQEPTSNVFSDSRSIVFPFPSNASQRRVAHLADEPANRIIVVQGPPGTGKSLTIANVACHLVSKGKKVLICSQKDKALSVVDEMLRKLDLGQLPMTLLRQDSESRRELRDRLDSIQKTRSVEDSRRDLEKDSKDHQDLVSAHDNTQRALQSAVHAEHLVAKGDREFAEAASILRKLGARWNRFQLRRRARTLSTVHSDQVGDRATSLRAQLLKTASGVLTSAADHRTCDASRGERNQLREFSKLLGRSQTNAKNFSVFDRLKKEPEKCRMLLKVLPCWIMSPDDVARLFPCDPGLFDTVIIDEASQCDLPSMTPVLFRASQAIIAGDSKQMQAQRFAFTSGQIAAQSWRQHGLDVLDPDGWLDPSKVDLLHLASVRLDEEAFLDEHYRSLPPIISFSNERWYGGRLRIMRDERDRRVGAPTSPIVTMTQVDGQVSAGTQENEKEARQLVAALHLKLSDPGYEGATFGVICLFEEQMRLVNDLVAETIDDDLRSDHDLVVVNPDGFQGDERDVIYYSMSYDALGMQKAALSARQAEREHLQGMLNVAFTRAREEIHVFHSAPIEEFGTASGKGAILDWLLHCRVQATKTSTKPSSVEKAQSEFEAEVSQELQLKGARIIAQYPSCGFFIDMVAELENERIAIECDGEIWHLDEHGQLKLEDLHRQEILERAGWKVLRIPYRSWKKNRSQQIERVLDAIKPEIDAGFEGFMDQPPRQNITDTRLPSASLLLSSFEAAVFRAVKSGAREEQQALRAALPHLGLSRLGPRVRSNLLTAIGTLRTKGVVSNEDGEMFVIEGFSNATITLTNPTRQSRGYRRRRRW